jgi:hypothetical protein
LLMVVAGWLHRQQAAVIEYLNAENRLLRERLGGRRIIFTDAERGDLANKAKAVGRNTLRELGTIVNPEVSASPPPPRAWPGGVSTFPVRPFGEPRIEQRLGQQLLELGVLCLERLQPLGVVNLRPAKLGPPAVRTPRR